MILSFLNFDKIYQSKLTPPHINPKLLYLINSREIGIKCQYVELVS